MVVAIDETGDDGGATGIPRLRTRTAQVPDIGIGAHGHEAATLDREGFGARLAGLHRNDSCVEHDQVGTRRGVVSTPLGGQHARHEAAAGKSKKIASRRTVWHTWLPNWKDPP